jgi:hypothetical protein
MNRRALRVVLVAGPILGWAVACTFPDVKYRDEGSTGEGGTSSSGNVDGSMSDGGPDVIKDSGSVIIEENDGALIDSSVPDDAAQVDPNTCDAHCDCDGDHWLRKGCTGYLPADDAAVPAKTSADDCDDTNSFIRPDQGLNDKVPTSYAPRDPPGDWNCSGVVEKSYDEDNCGSGTLGDCSSNHSFAGPIDCAKTAPYYSCKWDTLSLSCVTNNKVDDRPQGCH